MPRKRLPMRKIEEVLRLRAAGMNPRMIAASIGAGKTTVYECLARADAAGITWPLPEGQDWPAVEANLFPPPSAELANRRPVADWRAIHRELKGGRHVTLRLLGFVNYIWPHRDDQIWPHPGARGTGSSTPMNAESEDSSSARLHRDCELWATPW
jgi:hypothetical protein